MTGSALPVWRSLLFVPVTAKRFVDGAARRGADAIILDLEDSVAASEKERARTLVSEAATLSSRSRMIASAPRRAAPSTERRWVTGTNSSERQTGNAATVMAYLRRGR